MRATRWLFVICIALVSVLALLSVAEAIYRLRLRRAGVQQPFRYYRHARLSRALVRDVDYGPIHINKYGFRGIDFDSVKAPGTMRIIAVGASTTFDPCVHNDAETWPARLEHRLRELVPNQRFHVINAGVPGVPALDQVIRLQTELYAFDPDVFIVYANHGIVSAEDLGVTAQDRARPNAAGTNTPWDAWLRLHSRLYERIRPLQNQSSRVQLSTHEWQRATDNAAKNFERDLMSFTVIAQSLGAKVVLVEILRVTGAKPPGQLTTIEMAIWQRSFATPPDVLLGGYERFKGVWKTVASRTGAEFVPIEIDPITGAANFCYGEAIHFSKAGAEAMARRIANQLVGRNLVKPGTED